jgi:hypothetical protein
MSLLGRFKDIATGKIAKSNRLIQNHAVRFCEKIEKSDDKILFALIASSAACTTYFLEYFLLEAPDFKDNDGREEPNPFKKNLNRLDESKSCLRSCQLMCGNYFQGFVLPVLVEHIRDAIHNAVGTRFIGEEVIHGSRSSSHFAEGPLQYIGGPNGLP